MKWLEKTEPGLISLHFRDLQIEHDHLLLVGLSGLGFAVEPVAGEGHLAAATHCLDSDRQSGRLWFSRSQRTPFCKGLGIVRAVLLLHTHD